MPSLTDHRDRILTHSSQRVAWMRARARAVTGTDAAQFASDRAVVRAAHDKLAPHGFSGSSFTEHGRAREPEIATWVRRRYGIEPSTALFHAAGQKKHVATPDGLMVEADGSLVLAEIKTTSKPWTSIPRNYLRQVWWQQYVLGAERTLVVWEQHENFVPVGREPLCRWVDRDENEIAMLVRRADMMLMLIGELARPLR